MAEETKIVHLSNGYNIDFFQTARLLQWLARNTDRRWLKQETADDLGLAYVMVRYIAGTTAAMELIDKRTGVISKLGETILKIDPYLSSPVTPWVIHYNLGSNPLHLVWHRVAASLVCPGRVFDLNEAKSLFTDLEQSHSSATVMKHVLSELSVVFEAYTEGALSRLAYLAVEGNRFICPSMLRVPPIAFAYSLLSFSRRYRAGETAIDIGEITAAPSSPGRIFMMREPDVRTHLERMHRNDVVNIENKGHLDQVRFVNPPDPADYLLAHFEDTED
jgi:hypothetical protein